MMKKRTVKTLAAVLLLQTFSIVPGVSPVWASSDDSTLQPLLDQAVYWHNKSNDNRATESLNKVLMVDANNPQALYYMALWAQQRGDTSEAKRWQEQLRKAHPSAPQLQELQNSNQIKQLPKKRLILARQQANAGNVKAALETWQTLFDGSEPPLALAPEYYLTMAGDNSLYPTALKKLSSLSQRYPDNISLNITYAKVLTHREHTRRKGMDILESLADSQQEADSSLRQALLWLNPTLADEHYYNSWTQRHPQDTDILNLYKRKVSGGIRSNGFDELNRGNLPAAQKAFQTVLSSNPKDADALAGMGYVYLNKGDYSNAANYLNRSAELGGVQAKTRRKQAKEASFYAGLEKAKQASKSGNLDQALKISSSLAEQPGELGVTAKLYRADLLKQKGDYTQSERLLRNILKQAPANKPAKELLYYVLVEQNESEKAKKLLSSMPKEQQQQIQSADSYSNIRNLADQAVNVGNIETGIVILENGVERLPNNPWLRLELARLLEMTNRQAAADEVVTHLYRPQASNEELYAAALYAQNKKSWKEVNTLLGRIPESKRDEKMIALYNEALFNLKLELVRSYLSHGDKKKALETLNQISPDELSRPFNAGQYADLMVQCNEINSAVEVINQSLAKGITGNAGDYAYHVAILYKAGLKAEAQSLLNSPQLMANSTPLQLARARSVYVINEADTLREMGRYAEAYDLLTRALQQDPQNRDLMMAMARLYQSGKMNQQAGFVYNYLLENNLDTTQQDARIGAINIALADGDTVIARQLANELKDTQTPSRLLLMARIYSAEGDNQQAMASLRKARGKLLGMSFNYESSSPMQGGLVLADNPFRSPAEQYDDINTHSVYGSAMPWQVSGTNRQLNASDSHRIDLPELSDDQQTLSQVNQMMTQMDSETSSWVQGGVTIRGRDGESGLSKLTEAKAPIEWSAVPFGSARLKLGLTAVTLDAGSSSDNASRRFGTGALIQGEVAETEELSTLDGDTLPDVDSQGSQSESGVEVAISVEDELYKFDIGTTPLGFERNTLVGGVQWTPRINNFLTLKLSGERRLVKDSLLSYAGIEDEYSGKYWGQVTKNGLSVQLSYDDGIAGFYTSIGGWKYLGSNVSDNDNIGLSAGVYTRPYKQNGRELKAGVGISYQNFSKNLSYFSYGQGGYFSPQNAVNISFPVDYSQQFNNINLSIGGSVGYQSYSQDSSAYFPNDSDIQSELESYVSSGYAKEAYYSGDSTSGVGYNFHAQLEYDIDPNMILEASLLYDTFGSYNESIGQIWIRRSFKEY